MPTPPENGNTVFWSSAEWTAIGAGVLASMKIMRDAFHHRKSPLPEVNPTANSVLIELVEAVRALRSEQEKLREVIVAKHEARIFELEYDKVQIIRRLTTLEIRSGLKFPGLHDPG
jgi:hypothetical protein